MSELVRYDAMVHAIAECHRVDEVKEIHNQAAALEAAARIAMNTEAERKAIEIRIRAERKAGELLANMERGRTGPKLPASSAGNSSYRKTLDEAKIPERTAERWQELARVPANHFEEHLSAAEKPSASAIISAGKGKPQMSEEALWLWGRLRDFERMGWLDADPAPLIHEMTDAMRADVRRLAPLVASLMNRCTEKEAA